MDGLVKNSNGFWQDSEARLALKNIRTASQRDGKRYFSFMARFDKAVTVSWDEEPNQGVFPPDIGSMLLKHNWATSFNDDDAQKWNEMIKKLSMPEEKAEEIKVTDTPKELAAPLKSAKEK